MDKIFIKNVIESICQIKKKIKEFKSEVKHSNVSKSIVLNNFNEKYMKNLILNRFWIIISYKIIISVREVSNYDQYSPQIGL